MRQFQTMELPRIYVSIMTRRSAFVKSEAKGGQGLTIRIMHEVDRWNTYCRYIARGRPAPYGRPCIKVKYVEHSATARDYYSTTSYLEHFTVHRRPTRYASSPIVDPIMAKFVGSAVSITLAGPHSPKIRGLIVSVSEGRLTLTKGELKSAVDRQQYSFSV